MQGFGKTGPVHGCYDYPQRNICEVGFIADIASGNP